jgi:hypothetical protein
VKFRSFSRPGQSSQIKSTYKAEIARTLEPWVAGAQPTTASSSLGMVGAAASTVTNASASSQIPKDYAHPSVNLASADPGFTEPTYSQYYPMSRSTVTPVMGHKTPAGLVGGGGYAAPAGIGAGGSSGRKTPMAGGYSKSKGDTSDDHFAAHCRSFTAQVNVSATPEQFSLKFTHPSNPITVILNGKLTDQTCIHSLTRQDTKVTVGI